MYLNYKPKIFLGDCKDVLSNIKSNSIDLIFTSPPYADRRIHEHKTYNDI